MCCSVRNTQGQLSSQCSQQGWFYLTTSDVEDLLKESSVMYSNIFKWRYFIGDTEIADSLWNHHYYSHRELYWILPNIMTQNWSLSPNNDPKCLVAAWHYFLLLFPSPLPSSHDILMLFEHRMRVLILGLLYWLFLLPENVFIPNKCMCNFHISFKFLLQCHCHPTKATLFNFQSSLPTPATPPRSHFPWEHAGN